MFSRKRILSLVLVFGLTVLVFMGCKTDADDPYAEFSGTWKSSWDEYVIIDTSAKTIIYAIGSPAPDVSETGYDYIGDIVSDVNLLGSENGYLTIKVTAAGSGAGAVYSANKYIVYHWRNLTASTVDGSSAARGTDLIGKDTKNAAESEYTVDNGYFDMISTYSKQ